MQAARCPGSRAATGRGPATGTASFFDFGNGYSLSAKEGGDQIRVAYYAPTTTRSRPGISVLLLVYLVAGAIVAATHHYWSNLHTLKQIGSAILATVLWPLILLGINLHIH